jgi:hypothetical protein
MKTCISLLSLSEQFPAFLLKLLTILSRMDFPQSYEIAFVQNKDKDEDEDANG